MGMYSGNSGGGFSDVERPKWKSAIFSDVFSAMRRVITVMEEFEIELEYDNNVVRHQLHIGLISSRTVIFFTRTRSSQKMNASLRHIWNHWGLYGRIMDFKPQWREGMNMDYLKTYNSIHPFYPSLASWCLFHTSYFKEETLERIFSKDYVPTNTDILHSTSNRSGINEIVFEVGALQFKYIHTFFSEIERYRVYDIGRQQSKRQKWLHCFEGITVCIFVVDISTYDEPIEYNIDSVHTYFRLDVALTLERREGSFGGIWWHLQFSMVY
jgi:guanine nucleotide-binding protein subunit alpha, other